MVRLPGCGDSSTVVLAHFRLAGLCGTSSKPDDLLGAWCCFNCHNLVDGRTKSTETRDYLRLALAHGVMRTIAQLRKEGVKL